MTELVKSRQKSPTNKWKEIMNDGNYDASCMLILLLVSERNSSSVFYVAQSVHKKCIQMCRQWWTVKLHGFNCSWNHNTWTAIIYLFFLVILPTYKRCSSETFGVSSHFHFCFTRIIKHGYENETLWNMRNMLWTPVFLSLCIWLLFV
jgi:hypothetical protein